MRVRPIAAATLAAFVLALCAGSALARNPNCAGGIQYVMGGLRDKDKGLTEDYQRQMNKAVSVLEMCAVEDPEDYEAMGYLGWAYAELDSAGPAGRAFQKAIAGLEAKGDKKKLEIAVNNRDSYWANAFNAGIQKIGDAQRAYPEYAKPPADETEKTLFEESQKLYDESLVDLTRASLLRPGNVQTLRNLGSVYVFKGDYPAAMRVFENALKEAPDDSLLQQGLASVRQQYAGALVQQGKYDEAIQALSAMTKSTPDDGGLWSDLATAYFGKAQNGQGDSKKADYKLAAEAYAKASALKPSDPDLAYNSALAFQLAGDPAAAEPMWRKALKLRPDEQTLAGLAETLTDLKKYDDAVAVLRDAVQREPQNPQIHRQLGAVYSKAGNNAESTEELLAYLALKGKKADDPAGLAKAAKAGTPAAQTLAKEGAPDAVYEWTGDGQAYQSWFYWKQGLAFHFKNDQLAAKSDWSHAK